MSMTLSLPFAVHSLKCYCAEFFDHVEVTWDKCDSDRSCETTTGVCYANLRITKEGSERNTFNCLEDIHEVSGIRITCSILPNHVQVVECCNNTDFCNRDLNLTLPSDMPPTQSPTATITPTSDDSTG